MNEHEERPAQRRVRRRQARTTQEQPANNYDISISALGSSHRAGALDQAMQLFPASHLHMAREWQINCPIFFEGLRAIGFHMLYFIQHININMNMITALVERWCPATNTFHLPVGEMTITLEDVQVILGLRIDGEALVGQRLVGPGLRWPTWKECCIELLGNCPDPSVAFPDPDNNNNLVTFSMGATGLHSMMPLRWLRWVFHRESYDNLDDHTFVYHIRAYCLYMIGCLLLPDTSGSHVPLQYLPLLEDLQIFSQFSIGGAVLAHLYRELCLATNPRRVYIAGCLPLLQVWCWERITFSRPTMSSPTLQSLQGTSLARRWFYGFNRDQPGGNIMIYRNALDGLRHNQVIMTPYTQDLLEVLNSICRASPEIYTARVPLISYKRVEWHLPDRVMRQFGGVQSTEVMPIDRNFQRVDGRGRADVDWAHHHREHIALWVSRRQFITPISRPMRNGREELTTYLTWYKSWASLYLSRPPGQSSTTNDRNVMDYIVRSREIAGRFSGDHGESQSSMQLALDEIFELSSRLQDSLSIDYTMSTAHRAHEEQHSHRRSTYESSRPFSAGLPHNTAPEPPRHSMYVGSRDYAMPSTFEVGQSSQHRSPFEQQMYSSGVQQPSMYLHEFDSQTATTMQIPDWMSPLGIPTIPSQQDLLFQQSNVEAAPEDDDGQQLQRERRPPERYTPGSGAIPRRRRR